MKLLLKAKIKYLFLLLFVFLLSCSPHNKSTNSISVFAATSVTDVMNEIAQEFKKETGINVRLNFASSGILARQIESGAEFDYYVSASKDWMDYLDSLQLVDRNSITSLVENRMVAIVPIENTDLYLDSVSIVDFPDLFKGRISIGDPAHVPAGKYAMQIMINNSWENKLAKRILPAKDVRDALFMVEMGEVEMGMVYLSDAQKSKKVKMVYEFAVKDCDPMLYYGSGKVKSDKNLKAFISFLNEDKAKSIWKKNGFKID
ncbi:molybdate ABC transporter substrate-binding protein [Labilibaculum sp.]|uniref:molybdate ABC transporter substrate-binding protein n=1 Tax=Labilibaculum sp. TaxID=2060723 RepID=UPI002AA8F129|nr:molybdate ABC transporter substrate-binding protein [Labilibaculum sp.]